MQRAIRFSASPSEVRRTERITNQNKTRTLKLTML